MNLSTLPLPLKLSLTLFLTLSVGGLLLAEILVQQHLHCETINPNLLVELVKARYSYSPLHRAILTTMRKHLANQDELVPLIAWCQAGGQRSGFYEHIAPILNKRCLHCHGQGVTRGNVSLLTWADLAPLATIRGMPVDRLIRQTHAHVFGLGILILVLSLICNATHFFEGTRIWLIVVPYVALAMNIIGWWAAKNNELWAGVILVSGFILILWILVVSLVAGWELWLLKPRTKAHLVSGETNTEPEEERNISEFSSSIPERKP